MTRDQFAEQMLVDELYQDKTAHLCVMCDHLPNGHTFPGGRCIFVPGGRYLNEAPERNWKLSWRFITQVVRHDAEIRMSGEFRRATRERNKRRRRSRKS